MAFGKRWSHRLCAWALSAMACSPFHEMWGLQIVNESVYVTSRTCAVLGGGAHAALETP